MKPKSSSLRKNEGQTTSVCAAALEIKDAAQLMRAALGRLRGIVPLSDIDRLRKLALAVDAYTFGLEQAAFIIAQHYHRHDLPLFRDREAVAEALRQAEKLDAGRTL